MTPRTLGPLRDDERRTTLLCDVVDRGAHAGRKLAAPLTDVCLDCIRRALSDLAAFEIHAAHPRVRRERHERRTERRNVALPPRTSPWPAPRCCAPPVSRPPATRAARHRRAPLQ